MPRYYGDTQCSNRQQSCSCEQKFLVEDDVDGRVYQQEAEETLPTGKVAVATVSGGKVPDAECGVFGPHSVVCCLFQHLGQPWDDSGPGQ